MLYEKYPISVQDLTLERIGTGEFQKILPELYHLQGMIENNAWHDNESVFNHTMRVLYELEQIKKHAPERIKNYLNQKSDILGENTQWDTLYIATIFHDIGKSRTLQKSNQSTLLNNKQITHFPVHEKASVEMIPLILSRIFLSDLEKSIITSIIEYHGHLHNIIYPKNNNLELQYDNLMSYKSDITVELNIIAFADTLSASPLRLNNPEEFKFRTEFYKNMLLRY